MVAVEVNKIHQLFHTYFPKALLLFSLNKLSYSVFRSPVDYKFKKYLVSSSYSIDIVEKLLCGTHISVLPKKEAFLPLK